MNKVVIITAASKGIRAACANLLSKKRYKLVLISSTSSYFTGQNIPVDGGLGRSIQFLTKDLCNDKSK